MKRLFLASEAKHPKSIELLKIFVGGFRGKKIAYIPTAANGNNPYGEWELQSDTWKLVNNLGAKAEAIVLEEYKNISVLKKLLNKDIVWFSGGGTGYLLYWIRRCEIDKHIDEILTKAVYVGSSAGSMACSKTQYASELYIGESEPGASLLPGFGFVDFEIYPHYVEKWLPKLKKVWKKEYGDLWLLKNGEVITVEGSDIKLYGKKRILRDGKLITK